MYGPFPWFLLPVIHWPNIYWKPILDATGDIKWIKDNPLSEKLEIKPGDRKASLKTASVQTDLERTSGL